MRQFVSEEFCLKCTGCCRFKDPDSIWSPVLLDEDRQVLLRNKIPSLFILSNNKIRLEYYQKQDTFICSLLNQQDNKCTVYAFRPFECQLYPFMINRRNKDIFLSVDLKCPFVKENQDKSVFKEYIQYLTDLFNNPDLINSLRKNPQIIQAYEEVQDLIKLKI